ncbi:MAG: YlmH/Sll1252 family protein [Eubacteriales bacterium]|nr:YlmH/Sll1252 family protein [Eubacteriales bacterium]
MEDALFFRKRIQELASVAYQRDIVTFTDFLNLNELHMIKTLNSKELGVIAEAFGGYEHAERQLVAFHPDALSYQWEFPIVCIKVEPKSVRFSEALNHRDFLGALLNLGVERSTIGDILVEDGKAWFFCLERMADFFLENLTRVKHTFVTLELVADKEDFPKPRLEEMTGTCSSVRLDAMIALAFRQSRSSMTGLIESGNVYVNGRQIVSNGHSLKEGDIVSVRGKGRFCYGGIVNQTKKGKYSVKLYRYV